MEYEWSFGMKDDLCACRAGSTSTGQRMQDSIHFLMKREREEEREREMYRSRKRARTLAINALGTHRLMVVVVEEDGKDGKSEQQEEEAQEEEAQEEA